ncbi:MAG: hypothetical protein ACLRY5_11995 [Zhenhengia sp.]
MPYCRLIHQAVMVVITETGALDNELMYFTEGVSPDVLQSLAMQFSNALQNIGIGHVTAEALGTLFDSYGRSTRDFDIL